MDVSLAALVLCLTVVFAVLATPAFGSRAQPPALAAAQPYDAAYASIYDALVYDQAKTDFELEFLQPAADAYALDAGCGLGHHVAALGCPAVGLDRAPAMVAAAAARYPAHTFVVGDALDERAFSRDTFTHVLCLNHTLYYFRRKDRFLQNAYYWLAPGGVLALHLTDKLSYGPARAMRTQFGYIGAYTGSTYRERYFKGGAERRVEHRFYFETVATVLEIAQQCGFAVLAVAKYAPPYAGQYLYLLQKS